MPVNLPFIKSILEQYLGHSIEVRRFFDFLEDVIDSPSPLSPSPNQSLSNFIAKWMSCLHKSSKKMMILSYVGTWPPKCLTKMELQRQESWDKFVRSYDSSFINCTVNSQTSPEYQPLNFKELIRLTFWMEIYQTFGNKIADYIFAKCALLYEVDEGLYLLIAYSQGSIYKKMIKYDQNRLIKATNRYTPLQPLKTKQNNPYQLGGSSEGDNRLVEKENSDSPLNFHEQEARETFQPIEGTRKRAQIIPISEENGVKQPDKKRMKMEPCAGSVNRWILPKPEVLEKLIRHRESTLQSCNIPSSASAASGNETAKHVLDYVCVQKDDVFKPRDKTFVMKQKGKFSAQNQNPKLPRNWEGLKLPGNFCNMADSSGCVLVQVYIISETLAKKLEIRVKPKGRQLKKSVQNQQKAIPSTSHNSHIKEQPKTIKKLRNVDNVLSTLSERNLSNKQNISAASNQHIMNNRKNTQVLEGEPRTNTLSSKVEPYVSTHTLSIYPCLYNRSSRSDWPSAHCLTKAVTYFKQQWKSSSIRIIVDTILEGKISTKAAQEHLVESIDKKWIASDDANPLNKMILDIVQAHIKITNRVHKLFKSCISHWRMKYARKKERKLKTSLGKTSVAAVVDGSGKECNPTNSEKVEEPEVIDIAESTPSTYYTIPESLPAANIVNDISRIVVTDPTTCVPSCSIANENPKNSSSWENKTQRSKYELLRKSSGNTIKKKYFDRLKDSVPYNCVMQSLKQIFYLLKLDQLLGSKRNVRGFFKFVRKAVILGGIRSSLHLSELMALIHVSDIPIVHVTKSELAIETFAAKLVTWLFNDYILVLLKTSFYVTESNFSRMQVNFHLREAWTSAAYQMRSHLVEKGALELTGDQMKDPNAIIRYIPKQNFSLRTLLDTKKSAWSLTKEESKNLHIYLHYIDAKINNSRMYLPTTMQQTWRKFVTEWKESGSPKLFYLRMDIRDAFPSVSLKKLNEILLNTGSDRSQKTVMKQYALFGSNGVKRYRGSIFDQASRDNWHSGIHVRPCIALDLDRDKEVNTWKMLNHVSTITNTRNVVKLGLKKYNFHYGLPQGWTQSPILCNIYYGHIDTSLYLPYLESNGRLFLRVVDDYLVVSPSANELVNLIQLMKIGCDKYGIKMNDDKSITNIFVRSDEVAPANDCELITFCGWNFCMTCGHVSRDYKKYSGQDSCSSVTFQMPSSINSPEQFLRLRATLVVPARVKPILLDPSVNCTKRILLTTFEASIILGFRFYAICRVIYPNLNALKEEERVKAVVSCIHLCCTRLANYVARNARYQGPTFASQEKAICGENCCGSKNTSKLVLNNSAGNTANDPLGVSSLKYISLHGFRIKFRKHAGVFDKVLPHLNRSISKLRRNLGDIYCDQILEVVGTKMPECFSEIQI